MPTTEADIATTRSLLRQAIELQTNGDLAAAMQHFRIVVERGYRAKEVLPILAGILGQLGAVDQALERWDQLLELEPDHPVALHEKGLILSGLDQPAEALAAMKRAVMADPGNTLAANNFAVLLANAGRKHEAHQQFQRALGLEPGNIHIRHQLRRLAAEEVPFWHIPMMNDTPRNEAFEAAIKEALSQTGPDALVLDIGTGSGLLSMMAARAGARSIVTCEMIPLIADMAEQIVAQNGYAEQIDIFAKPSTQIEVGVELADRADILISEILSGDLLTENVLSTFEDARARLLKEDAIIIPRAASAFGCLVESRVLEDYIFVNEVSGFDLSRFGAFAAQKLPIHGTMTDWRRLSADIELVRVDLTQKHHQSQLNLLKVAVLEDGVASGIVQWMHVDLAEGVSFDNHPDGYTDGGWLQILHSFPQPLPVRAGEILELAVGHDCVTLLIQPLAIAAVSDTVPQAA